MLSHLYHSTQLEFARPFIVEPDLLEPDLLRNHPSSGASELLKRTVDVLLTYRDNPAALTITQIRDAAKANGSQIKIPETYLRHLENTGSLTRYLVEKLRDTPFGIDLPEPAAARGYGLIHDLSSIFARHGRGDFDNSIRFTQEDKELTLYIVGKVQGIEALAEAALHSAYYEIAAMIAQGEGFAKIDLYQDWVRAFNQDGHPFNFRNLKLDFKKFETWTTHCSTGMDIPVDTPEDRTKLTVLKVLTVADYLENGQGKLNLDSLETDFTKRSMDVVYRYHQKPLDDGHPPTALGVALTERGGLKRIAGYKQEVQLALKP